MLLGAETIRPLLRRLLPEAEHINRPRFSTLSYAGPRKISRLPRRCAVVAFSAAEVYGLAEQVRRQRGGAAVVMGALSPRTRNAQVAMYQAGEVDYLVATDAIGMGLNMDVGHVAFASLTKFDGHRRRLLTAAEIGQIAGRAGRHMSDGSFGATAELGALEQDVVERVENHRFESLKGLAWRNPRLDYRSLAALLRSLEVPPPVDCLSRAREVDDYLALKALSAQADVARLATTPAALRLLWEVCQIPDFRKTLAEIHARLLSQIYRHLMAGDGVLPSDWVARHVARLDRVDGDIDTLAGRIAHIRTWTYVSHRPSWIDDARHWQERTRAIEDRLSDALHDCLTQRFVDRRTVVLSRRLRDAGELEAAIEDDGSVLVEGEFVGRLEGFRFVPDPTTSGPEGRTLRAAAKRALRSEIEGRVAALAGAPDEALSLDADGRLWWRGARVARLTAGGDVLRPWVRLDHDELLTGRAREHLLRRLEDWIEGRVHDLLTPLLRLRDAPFSGAARGLAFQLVECLGTLPRRRASAQLGALTPSERRTLRRHGVRFGAASIFLPALRRGDRAAFSCALWAVHNGLEAPPAPPRKRAVAAADLPEGYYAAAGFRVYGQRAVRADAVERLGAQARRLDRAGPFLATAKLQQILGGDRSDLEAALADLGYRVQGEGADAAFSRAHDPGRGARAKTAGKATGVAKGEDKATGKRQDKDEGRRRARSRRRRPDPHSPFARLKELKVPAR
jgi:ATP-dependent RNA helicase SUPV3L1/SUV3